MSDRHGGSVPSIPEPAATPPPRPAPPPQRSGCVTAILIVFGLILLLPGLCVILLVSTLGGRFGREEIQLTITCGIAAAGGIALIVWGDSTAMSDPFRDDPPRPPQRPQRNIAVSIILVLVGIVLLLPGACALLFMALNRGGTDGSLLLLWLVCLAISAGGVALIVKAFR